MDSGGLPPLRVRLRLTADPSPGFGSARSRRSGNADEKIRRQGSPFAPSAVKRSRVACTLSSPLLYWRGPSEPRTLLRVCHGPLPARARPPSPLEAIIEPVRHRLAALLLLTLLASLPGVGAGPSPALGQAPATVGAELPRPGTVWLETAPVFQSWSEQFASGSDSLSDGSREPLDADYRGPVAERLHPGPALVAEAVNRGADSLGFGPMDAGELSLGSLEFGSITARRTTVPVRALLGVTGRIALDVGVSFVQTQTDASFRYDSTGATVAPATLALEDGSGYLDAMSSARSTLEDRIEGGDLPPDREEAARALLRRSGAFTTVLGRKLESAALLPLAGSRPGNELSGFASDLRSSFQEFGIQAPDLSLASVPGAGALETFLTGPLMEAEPLRGASIGLQPAELELGLRVGLMDTFRSGEEATEARAGPPTGLALRTTAGVRVHWPLSEPDQTPFLTPSRFLDTPAGPGARVVEATVYQDAAVGAFEASAAAGLGLRLPDEVTLRIHEPGQPLALAATRSELRREPGNYFWFRLSPRVRANPHLSMGAEYAFWREGQTRFSRLGDGQSGDSSPSAIDPVALERETGARRHSVGIGVYYTAGSGSSDGPGPVEAAFTYRLAVAGSGGQTPAANIMGVRIRVPVSVGLF